MFFRLRIRFLFAVVLLLLGCTLTTPVVADDPPAQGATTGTTATNTPPTVEDIEAKQAAKEADEKAKRREKLKAELVTHPLVVVGIDPYVANNQKANFFRGTDEDKKKCLEQVKRSDEQDKKKCGEPPTIGRAGMGDGISVVIPRLTEAAELDLIVPNKLVLFIDGRVFKGVYPQSVGYDSLAYKLERTTDAIDAWNDLLGRPTLNPIKNVAVSVGYADQEPLGLADPGQKTNLDLIVYRKRWAVGSLIVLMLMLLVFWKYGGTDLLRDSGPPNPEPGKRPYSLAKVQVAWWFFLVIGCFLLIYLITGEFTMTEQALILIGIGTGTALGSAMIENSKRGTADSELETLKPQHAKLSAEIDLLKIDKAALETAIAANPGVTEVEKASLKTAQDSLNARKIELAGKSEQLDALSAKIAEARSGLTQPTSKTFWDDLVTDANGPSFHRFQMIAWTVILGILFLAAVYKNLAMPQFSGTMLALMGISAGTYLGFKIPERQSTPDEKKPDEKKPDEQKPTDQKKADEKKLDDPVKPDEEKVDDPDGG